MEKFIDEVDQVIYRILQRSCIGAKTFSKLSYYIADIRSYGSSPKDSKRTGVDLSTSVYRDEVSNPIRYTHQRALLARLWGFNGSCMDVRRQSLVILLLSDPILVRSNQINSKLQISNGDGVDDEKSNEIIVIDHDLDKGKLLFCYVHNLSKVTSSLYSHNRPENS